MGLGLNRGGLFSPNPILLIPPERHCDTHSIQSNNTKATEYHENTATSEFNTQYYCIMHQPMCASSCQEWVAFSALSVSIESRFFLCRSSLCLGLTLWTTSMLSQHPGSPKASNQTNSPADGESKHKNKPGFDTLGSTRSPFATTFEANYDEGVRHSERRDRFQQFWEYKVQFGHCLVPRQYSANPRLGTWVRYQRARYRKSTEENSTCMIAGWADSSTRRYWFRLGETHDWFGIHLERTISTIVLIQDCVVSINKYSASSGIGFRLSAGTTDCTTRKESQVPWQRSVFESSTVLDSNGSMWWK